MRDNNMTTKLLRVTTVPTSLISFCTGLMRELTEDGYEVVAVSSPNTSAAPGETRSELEEFGRQEGVRTIAVPMERRISPTKDLKSLWRMWRVLRRERPDMVHSMTPKAGLVTMLAAWLARVPVRIHTFTGLVFPTETGLKRRLLMATDWLTCACATHVIPEGEGVKADLLNHGITHKPLKVLGYGNIKGIDLDHWNREAADINAQDIANSASEATHTPLLCNRGGECESHAAGTEMAQTPPLTPPLCERGGDVDAAAPFRFVFVGRIVGDKGINELVAAFKRLHDELPGTKLTLVGPFEENIDPIKPETRAEIERNPAIDAVGSQSDVRPYYVAADALVFPSYREGFPNVVLEAGAMGLPSIVTDINGSREIIIEGRNGTIVPPRDEEALYRAMRHWVTHRDEVARMAAEARPLIASRFEQGYVRRCLKEFYRQVAKR